MIFLWLLPVILSLVLLGAHFLFHTGQVAFAVLPLLFLIPLFFRKAWVPWLIEVALLLGTVEWVRTLVIGVAQKSALGKDWFRYAIILGAVALFTNLSSLVFRSRSLRMRYSGGE